MNTEQELRRARAAMLVLSSMCQEESWLDVKELDDCFIINRRTSLEGEFVQGVINGSSQIVIRVVDKNTYVLSRWTIFDRAEAINTIATGLGVSESDIENAVSINLMSDSCDTHLYINLTTTSRDQIVINGRCVDWSMDMILGLIIRIKRKLNLPLRFKRTFD